MGPENFLAEKPFAFGFEGTVVDCLGLFDFAPRPLVTDMVRVSDGDTNPVKRLGPLFFHWAGGALNHQVRHKADSLR